MERKGDQRVDEEARGAGEQSFSTTMEAGGLFVLANSVVVLGTGATADSVCFSWLERRGRILQRESFPRVSTYLASARFRFGDGHLGVVRHAADIPVGISGDEGTHGICTGFRYSSVTALGFPWWRMGVS